MRWSGSRRLLLFLLVVVALPEEFLAVLDGMFRLIQRQDGPLEPPVQVWGVIVGRELGDGDVLVGERSERVEDPGECFGDHLHRAWISELPLAGLERGGNELLGGPLGVKGPTGLRVEPL